MVNIGQKFNLNHIYHINVVNTVIAIGQDGMIEARYLELFQKSLALTGDLRRLPIARGLSKSHTISPTVAADLSSSNQAVAVITVYLFNDDIPEDLIDDVIADEDILETFELLWKITGIIVQASGVFTVIDIEAPVWDYEGGILLNDRITLALAVDLSGNVATTDFPANKLGIDVFLEVDWCPVTSSEFKDFIVENVYAKGKDIVTTD